MGFPSGLFSSANSGRLQVTFCADYLTNSGADFTHGSTLNIIIRCFVGTGASRQTSVIDAAVHGTVIERDYVGGSGGVLVGMEEISHSFSGPSSIRAFNLACNCYLIKR